MIPFHSSYVLLFAICTIPTLTEKLPALVHNNYLPTKGIKALMCAWKEKQTVGATFTEQNQILYGH
jgi:hypothetical protein